MQVFIQTKMMQRRRDVKHSHALSFTTFFFIFFLSSYSSYAELTDKGDIRKQKFKVLALLEIKSSLIGPHEVFMNWDGTRLDACSWNMITCSPDGFVVGLEIPSQNLSGTLSSSISNLTNLQTLLLQNNSITGHIPHEIGKLMKLNTLDLSTNNFNGQIPSSISHITNLQYFIMGNPQICPTGTEQDCNGTQPMSTTLNSSRNEASDGGTKIQKIVVAFGLSLTCVCLFDHWLWFSSLAEKKT